MRVGPPAERKTGFALTNQPPQIPRVLDASRMADGRVTAENDERRETSLPRLLGVRETKIERVLTGEERRHQVARQLAAKVGAQVPEVVFFRCADGAVREKRRNAMSAQTTDLMVTVDPRIHALHRSELGSRRAKLHGNNGVLAAKRVLQHHSRDDRVAGVAGSVTR